MMKAFIPLVIVSLLLFGCCITGPPTVTTPTPAPGASPTGTQEPGATSTPALEPTGTPSACGPTITSCNCSFNSPGTYVLGQDLTCEWGMGFYQGASGSTLDCQGHTIRASSDGSGTGLYAIDASDLTIRNCRLDGFYSGTQFTRINNCRIQNNTFLNGPNGGMALISSNGCRITGNTAIGNSNGLYLSDCNNTLVANNTANLNTYGGLNFGNSAGLVVSGNTLNGNRGGILVGNCTNGEFERNTITSSNSSAIWVYDSTGNRIESNTLSGGAWGIEMRNTTGNTFARNLLRNSSLAFYCEDALANIDGGSNTCGGSQSEGCAWVSCP